MRALDRGVMASIEKRGCGLGQQNQLRNARADRMGLHCGNQLFAKTAAAQVFANGQGSQKAGEFKAFKPNDADQSLALHGHDEIYRGTFKVADGQMAILQQALDSA